LQVNYNGFHLLMNQWKDTQTLHLSMDICMKKLTWTKTCKIIIFVSCKGHEQTSFIDEWMKNHTNILFVYGHFMRNWNG
jgi:hypothetical protein